MTPVKVQPENSEFPRTLDSLHQQVHALAMRGIWPEGSPNTVDDTYDAGFKAAMAHVERALDELFHYSHPDVKPLWARPLADGIHGALSEALSCAAGAYRETGSVPSGSDYTDAGHAEDAVIMLRQRCEAAESSLAVLRASALTREQVEQRLDDETLEKILDAAMQAEVNATEDDMTTKRANQAYYKALLDNVLAALFPHDGSRT